MQYQILVPVRARSIASMTTNDSEANAPAGTTFNSSVQQVDSITPSHPTMVQAQDGVYSGKWFPIQYNGVTYLQEVIAPPSAPTLTHNMKVYSDGSVEVYDASGTVLQYKG